MFFLRPLLAATAIATIFARVPAYADPAVMVGLSLNFGAGDSKLGATAKLLSDDEPDKLVAAGGVTYFFNDSSFGLDAGFGYTFDGGAITLTYDFTNQSPQLSGGVAEIKAKVIDTVC